MKNWLISYQRHSVSQIIPRFSQKKIPSFHQNSLNDRIIFLHLPQNFKKALRRWVSATGLEEISKQPNRSLKQQLKQNLMI